MELRPAIPTKSTTVFAMSSTRLAIVPRRHLTEKKKTKSRNPGINDALSRFLSSVTVYQ
jgi:hypothetical protein